MFRVYFCAMFSSALTFFCYYTHFARQKQANRLPGQAIPYRFCHLMQKTSKKGLTHSPFCAIIRNVDGALAQLVAHNTGSVGVRSSNLLCSTKPKKSEHHPDWGWVRIFSFYLKYCGVKHTTGLSEHLRRLFGASPIENLWAKIRSFS